MIDIDDRVAAIIKSPETAARLTLQDRDLAGALALLAGAVLDLSASPYSRQYLNARAHVIADAQMVVRRLAQIAARDLAGDPLLDADAWQRWLRDLEPKMGQLKDADPRAFAFLADMIVKRDGDGLRRISEKQFVWLRRLHVRHCKA